MATDALGNVDTFDYALRGGGKLYIRDIGSTGAWDYFGESHTVEQNIETENVEIMNTESCTQSVGKTTAKSSKLTLNFETDEYSPETIALAFLGTQASGTVAAVTAEAVVIASANLGGYHDLGHFNIDTAVVQDDADTITYVMGTDYTLDTQSGMLGIITGGAITEADELHVAVTTTEYVSATVQYLDNVSVEKELRFIGCPSSGDAMLIDFYKVSISANGAVGVKGDEFISIAMTGVCASDSSKAGTGISEFATYQVMPVSA